MAHRTIRKCLTKIPRPQKLWLPFRNVHCMHLTAIHYILQSHFNGSKCHHICSIMRSEHQKFSPFKFRRNMKVEWKCEIMQKIIINAFITSTNPCETEWNLRCWCALVGMCVSWLPNRRLITGFDTMCLEHTERGRQREREVGTEIE